jgi:hypothetical protein
MEEQGSKNKKKDNAVPISFTQRYFRQLEEFGSNISFLTVGNIGAFIANTTEPLFYLPYLGELTGVAVGTASVMFPLQKIFAPSSSKATNLYETSLSTISPAKVGGEWAVLNGNLTLTAHHHILQAVTDFVTAIIKKTEARVRHNPLTKPEAILQALQDLNKPLLVHEKEETVFIDTLFQDKDFTKQCLALIEDTQKKYITMKKDIEVKSKTDFPTVMRDSILDSFWDPVTRETYIYYIDVNIFKTMLEKAIQLPEGKLTTVLDYFNRALHTGQTIANGLVSFETIQTLYKTEDFNVIEAAKELVGKVASPLLASIACKTLSTGCSMLYQKMIEQTQIEDLKKYTDKINASIEPAKARQ